MGDSSVFTEDPVEILNAPSCANQYSQIVRFEGSNPEGELSKSSPIQLEVPHVGTTPLKTLAEIALAVDARSTIANDPAMGEASLSHSSDSALQEVQGFEAGVHDSNPVKSHPIQLEVPTTSGGQLTVINIEQSVSKTVTSVTGGSDTLIAQPSTSQPPQPHLVSNWLQEAAPQSNLEEFREGNYDASLNKDYNLEIEDVLARFRENYLTILGSNSKALTPSEVYDAVNEVSKAQLKAFHLFGKAQELKLTGHEDRIRKLVKDKMDEIIPSQNSVTLGAIMGKLNISLHALPEQIRPEISTLLLMPVPKTKGDIEAGIAKSRDAKTQSKEPVRVGQSSGAQVDVGKERLLRAAERPNQDQEINDLLVTLRVTLSYLQTLRASELDVMIDRVNPVIQKDTQLLQELKKTQISTFPEAYLHPHKGVVYYNLRKDEDDDEQKDDKKNPSSSNPSQASKATGSKDEKKKGEDKKDEERKRRTEWLIEREERRRRNEAEYEERKRKYDDEIEIYIKRSGEVKAKGMRRIPEDGSLVNRHEFVCEAIFSQIGGDCCARHANTLTRLSQIDNPNIKPKNSIWKKIKKIMPQKNPNSNTLIFPENPPDTERIEYKAHEIEDPEMFEHEHDEALLDAEDQEEPEEDPSEES
ncbi:hypothetical protein AgCh_004842 [Apium graveolens]